MNFIARLVSCFIPVPRVRRRVRKSLRAHATTGRKDDRAVAELSARQAEQNAAQQAAADSAQKEELHKKYDAIKQEWHQRNNGVALLPGRFAEYDLVFATGSACYITWYLDANKLRRFTTPLDWTGGTEPLNWWSVPNVWRDTRFREKIDALCNEFVDYFNPDDIMPQTQHLAGNEQWVINRRTNIRYMHLFSDKGSIESQMPAVLEKMQRRAACLIDAIKKSDRILLCWAHRIGDGRMILDAPVSDDDILRAVDMLRKKWPGKQFDLVFFEHDGAKAAFEVDKIAVADGVFRIRSNHFITENAYLATVPYNPITGTPILSMAEAFDNIKLTTKLA